MQTFNFHPEKGETSAKRRVVEALMNRNPQNLGQGLEALGEGIAVRRDTMGAFPTAPGGNPFAQGLRNMFAMNRPGKTGGLW